MMYLFWAFAVVWLGLFAYVYALVRRSRALEEELRRLDADAGRGGRSTAGQVSP